mgnify:CR=1 FL=1
MERVACIDIGTVTVRLAVADVEDAQVLRLVKRSTICDLGEGLSASGRISDDARGRVMGCVDAYIQIAMDACATYACCTLTSAARDASNASDLLTGLARRGLDPQVISGEVEGSLTFLGVARDFAGSRILVADNGGGSTELALGSMLGGGELDLECVRSTDVGCRRITERFLSASDPPSGRDIEAARSFARESFFAAIAKEHILERGPVLLVVTGGTATNLVAIEKKLEPYDTTQVHCTMLLRERVDALASKLATLTVKERAALPGLQPKRAPVILAGALAISELMSQVRVGSLVVSESDLLFGLAICVGQAAAKEESPLDWEPALSSLCA